MKNAIIILSIAAMAGVFGCGRQSAADEIRAEKRLMKKESSKAARMIAENVEISKNQIQAELEELTKKVNTKLAEIPADSTEKAERLRRELKLRKLQMNNALAALATVPADQWPAMKRENEKLISEVDNLLRNTSKQ